MKVRPDFRVPRIVVKGSQMWRKVRQVPGRGEGSSGRKEEAVVGRCSVLLQASETMTSLVSCGTVRHWAFAESSRDNIIDAAVDLCGAQTCLGGGVGAA